MFAAIAIFAALPLACSVVASPLLKHDVADLGHLDLLERRQSTDSSGFVAVTGVTGYGAQPRLEIRQLQQDNDQWNIYLLGLHRMQQTNESDKLSYYQIAGIHGRPYIPWDGVQAAPGIDAPGYCTHVSNLFLPWHRPFLALYEQVLYQHVIAAVNEFPSGATRQRYAQAAVSFRQPYWDWATPPLNGDSVWPTSLTWPTVEVTMPNGTTTIPNPLYSYRFHPVKPEDFYFNPFASWTQTMRWPTNWYEDATTQDNLLGPVLDNNRISFMDRLYNLFTNYNNYTQFGTEAWMNGGVQNADSLESIHDAIHGIVGSQGHMTYLDYSAFDPVFWLHHAMLDRIFALWQELYPDSYVEPMAALEQSFTIPSYSVQDVHSPLDPFHSNAQGDVWTSETARSVTKFGYTYPELMGNASASTVRAAINKLYSNSANSGRQSGSPSKRWYHGLFAQKREVPTESHSACSEAAAYAGSSDNCSQHEYIANIISQKFALNTSYAIYVFLGAFDDTPTCYPFAPNLVGTHGVFATVSADMASNPPAKARRSMAMAPIAITGTMPLTSMLLAKAQSGELASMRKADVEAFLRTNLQWRVAYFDGTPIPASDVPDLSITVVRADVQPASEDEFPRWSNYVELKFLTEGRPGGC